MKHIFVGVKKASKWNLHLLKRDKLMNDSYHISSFWSLREFTDKLPFLWNLLNCKLPKREENCLLDVYILTRELYVFTRKDLCFGTCRQVVYCLNLAFDPRRKKWYLRLYSTQIIQSNGKMLFAWRKNCLSKFLWCAAHFYLFFTSRKSSVFRTRRQVSCEMFIV